MLQKCKYELVGLIYTFMPARFSILTKVLDRYAFVWLARFMQLAVCPAFEDCTAPLLLPFAPDTLVLIAIPHWAE
ncbi:MAG TPA: hypothetical protein VF797_05015 [Noviherbaspirillum sp.]